MCREISRSAGLLTSPWLETRIVCRETGGRRFRRGRETPAERMSGDPRQRACRETRDERECLRETQVGNNEEPFPETHADLLDVGDSRRSNVFGNG